jgi:hypothetical protein
MRLLLLILLLSLPASSNNKISFIVKSVDLDKREAVIQPVLSTYFNVSGDTLGLVKGEVLNCKVVSTRTRKPGIEVQDFDVECEPGKRKFKFRTIMLTPSR